MSETKDLSQEIFDEAADKASDFISNLLDSVIEKHKGTVSEDDRFDNLTDPVMAAVIMVICDYYSHIGYPKGTLLERVCDFFHYHDDDDDDDNDNSANDNHVN